MSRNQIKEIEATMHKASGRTICGAVTDTSLQITVNLVNRISQKAMVIVLSEVDRYLSSIKPGEEPLRSTLH